MPRWAIHLPPTLGFAPRRLEEGGFSPNLVKRELYYAEENVEAYSTKPHVVELRWRYSDARAEQLVEYITDHLKTSKEVEIWKVWVDEQTEPNVQSITLDELTIDTLRFLGADGFERPECLRVTKA